MESGLSYTVQSVKLDSLFGAEQSVWIERKPRLQQLSWARSAVEDVLAKERGDGCAWQRPSWSRSVDDKERELDPKRMLEQRRRAEREEEVRHSRAARKHCGRSCSYTKRNFVERQRRPAHTPRIDLDILEASVRLFQLIQAYEKLRASVEKLAVVCEIELRLRIHPTRPTESVRKVQSSAIPHYSSTSSLQLPEKVHAYRFRRRQGRRRAERVASERRAQREPVVVLHRLHKGRLGGEKVPDPATYLITRADRVVEISCSLIEISSLILVLTAVQLASPFPARGLLNGRP
jgi:hypothetical protein